MQRIVFAFLALLVVGAGALRADQTTSAVQQALKDQGFYYGDVTGEKTADTTAAIRRYQIRNGLQITGEIDAETLRSLGVGGAGARAAAQPRATTPPEEETEANSGDTATQSAEISPPPPPAGYAPQGTGGLRPEASGVFQGTPYEIAPPDLQRHVIVGAQTLLARYGYYRSGIDGEFGPGTAVAVRTFQSRAGLVPDGRLNMETLGALGLLPGQHAPGFSVPRRRLQGRPIYRGQWIPGT
ncbi:MAG TPA: peptidoglycan-binding protein [Chthoniobacterales bacterium]|nr:peptidoglycan-binding protein [Chthoniobacterales bacterium]